MRKITFTKRFVARVQHRLVQVPYPEVRHGHACKIEITLSKAWEQQFIELVRQYILQYLDGQLLNDTLPVATGENLVEWIFTELEKSVLGKDLLGVCVQETLKNRFVSSRNHLLVGEY